ncbi:hypothetical protein L1285_04330 [Pseudoalteromonas sp. DL2-H2.2]|uniref:hypothetical protein n=1 Tax=Pseudoalteromonas sp. DL2-H2.2 TaxID=2908889 RepID=UPI001F32E4D8|nr:hypothetical protein [Pseudoalteromonas sp. DL2-H2.2]MCF2907544.1 hypothetical protein [Pseudoalteromonas sp. DL2-H2.2]
MNLKLNKKKMKSLSSDSNNMPRNMTPQVAGGTDINSSKGDTYSGLGHTHCVANTCGMYGCEQTL